MVIHDSELWGGSKTDQLLHKFKAVCFLGSKTEYSIEVKPEVKPVIHACSKDSARVNMSENVKKQLSKDNKAKWTSQQIG